jgi:hypothetical protein
MFQRKRLVCALIGVALCTPLSVAGVFHKHGAAPCGCESAAVAPDCGVTYVTETRTIMVSEMVSETRMITTTECKLEAQTRLLTRYRSVPVTQQVPYTWTEFEQQVRPVTRTRTVPVTEQVPYTWTAYECQQQTRQVNYTELVPVTRPVVQTYTELVPTVEQRTGTRKVAHTVAVQVPQTVTKDLGHFEEQCVEVPVVLASSHGTSGSRFHGLFRKHKHDCDSCAPVVDACDCGPQMTTVTKKVWVPKMVTETVITTVNKVEWVEEPHTWTVTVCRPVTKQRTVNVTTCEAVAKTRTETFSVQVPVKKTGVRTVTTCKLENYVENVTVCVPITKTGTRAVTTYRCEAYTENVTVNVSVPVSVQKPITVQVCRQVPKTITVQVPVPVASTGCGDCGAPVVAKPCCK